MGYIFVYTNSDYNGLTGIGYAEDWKKEIQKLNDDPNNLGFISCDSAYLVSDKSHYDRFIKIINTISHDARVKKQDGRETDYYKLPVNDVHDLLDSFISERDSGGASPNKQPVHEVGGQRTKKEAEALSPNQVHKRGPVLDYLLVNGYISDKKNCNFASRNSQPPHYYWANPQFTCLETDWTIILDDTLLNKFYIFKVPGGSIKKYELRSKQGYPNKIEITINYDDPTYTDSTSGYSFAKYKVNEIDYSLETPPQNNKSETSISEKKVEDELDFLFDFDEDFESDYKSDTQTPYKKKNYIDNTRHLDTKVTLANIDDVKYGKPYKIELFGKEYRVKAWIDVLTKTLEILYNNYPSIIDAMASNNTSPHPNCKRIYITKNERIYGSVNHKKLKSTNIYYLANLSSALIIDFAKFLLKECGIRPSELTIWYK